MEGKEDTQQGRLPLVLLQLFILLLVGRALPEVSPLTLTVGTTEEVPVQPRVEPHEVLVVAARISLLQQVF